MRFWWPVLLALSLVTFGSCNIPEHMREKVELVSPTSWTIMQERCLHPIFLPERANNSKSIHFSTMLLCVWDCRLYSVEPPLRPLHWPDPIGKPLWLQTIVTAVLLWPLHRPLFPPDKRNAWWNQTKYHLAVILGIFRESWLPSSVQDLVFQSLLWPVLTTRPCSMWQSDTD